MAGGGGGGVSSISPPSVEDKRSFNKENGRFFLAERTMCSKLWCSEREHWPFRDLNASVALVPDEGKGGKRGEIREEKRREDGGERR